MDLYAAWTIADDVLSPVKRRYVDVFDVKLFELCSNLLGLHTKPAQACEPWTTFAPLSVCRLVDILDPDHGLTRRGQKGVLTRRSKLYLPVLQTGM